MDLEREGAEHNVFVYDFFLLKVEPVMTDLRRVRSEATTVRKEGVVRNGTEKAKLLEEASPIWAMVEMVGLPSFYNYYTREGDQP